MSNQLFLAIDIGAGQGTRIGLFDAHYDEIDQEVLTLDKYGPDYPAYLSNLIATIGRLTGRNDGSRPQLRAVGIASAGIMNRDGSFKLAANLPLLIGRNLRADLEAALGLTVRIANDADAGALGEWSVLRQEMLYWVFGGGWGGAWVSEGGHVRFPSIGWDGLDGSLHLTNEPGYASPLDKTVLRRLFAESGACFEHWEHVMLADFGGDAKILVGPSGRDDKLRAEAILSGPGRCRLFKAVAAGNRFHERFLSSAELAEMDNPAVAGRHISRLSALQVPAAVETDRLFGRILAHAAGIIFENARADGLPEGVPVALGGKPAQALPWFGPACQAELARLGISSYLRPGVIASRGGNANLLGAAVLAVQGD